MNTYHVVGTPGSGKTTRSVDLARQIVQEGVTLDRICFTSFTKAAAEEVIRRISSILNVDPKKDLPLFGTLQSLASRFLDLKYANFLRKEHWFAFCNRYQYRSTGDLDESEEPDRTQQCLGDFLLAMYTKLINTHARLPTPKDIADYVPLQDQDDLRIFSERLERFKHENGLYHYTDTLLVALREGWVPEADVCFIDEAQDLTGLQAAIVSRWVQERDCVLAYDEDQAIYDWAGADPAWLLKLPGDREFLVESHRLPKTLVNFSQRLISRNTKRYPKKVHTLREGGEVHKDVFMTDVVREILRVPEKSWFLLARTKHLVRSYEESLSQAGILFNNLLARKDNRPSAAVIAFFKLYEKKSVTKDELFLFLQAVPWRGNLVYGTKTKLMKDSRESFTLEDLANGGATYFLIEDIKKGCMDRMNYPPLLIRTYKALYKANGLRGLTTTPNVTLSTVHRVKGREADAVVLLPNHSVKCEKNDPEPERRVWYVGITRAKSELYILKPKPGYFFQELTRLPVADSVFGSCT